MDIKKLETVARQVRYQVVKMLYKIGGGHLASSMSTIEILTAIYFGGLLKFKADQPDWPERDYFLLSNGHACPSYYTILAKAGYFSETKMAKDLFKLGSGWEGHPVKNALPGIEISSGSLGMGLSVGVGIALGLKRAACQNQVVVMMSDGEQQEGSVWEAAMAARHYQLGNLIAIVDANGIQIGGFIEKNLSIKPLAEKYLSFGWAVKEVDGHSIRQIIDSYKMALEVKDRPTILIAKTIPAKGIFGWEGKPDTHHKKLTKEIYQQTLESFK